MGPFTSCCLRGVGGDGRKAPNRKGRVFRLYPGPLVLMQKGRKCDPGSITAGVATFANGEPGADEEVSVGLPVGCFVKCGRLTDSLGVKISVHIECPQSSILFFFSQRRLLSPPSQRFCFLAPSSPLTVKRVTSFAFLLRFLLFSSSLPLRNRHGSQIVNLRTTWT